jgi:hypothetical protein
MIPLNLPSNETLRPWLAALEKKSPGRIPHHCDRFTGHLELPADRVGASIGKGTRGNSGRTSSHQS